MKYELGSTVKRIGSEADYTTGRTGTVIEYDDVKDRYRVFWTKEASGRDVLNGRNTVGVRTWVQAKYLIKGEHKHNA